VFASNNPDRDKGLDQYCLKIFAFGAGKDSGPGSPMLITVVVVLVAAALLLVGVLGLIAVWAFISAAGR